jgi:hypothetical protein
MNSSKPIIFLLTSANTLGYLRSFGGYIAAIIFSASIFFVIAIFVWFANLLKKFLIEGCWKKLP